MSGAAERPRCDACDAVCCQLTVVLMAEDTVAPHLTTVLPSGVHVMAHGDDGWCIALDRLHMRCSIYADRPAICRKFHMGGPYCIDIREEYAEHGPRSIPLSLE